MTVRGAAANVTLDHITSCEIKVDIIFLASRKHSEHPSHVLHTIRIRRVKLRVGRPRRRTAYFGGHYSYDRFISGGSLCQCNESMLSLIFYSVHSVQCTDRVVVPTYCAVLGNPKTTSLSIL